jgi:tRNA (cmo5U34)-methyltransferase
MTRQLEAKSTIQEIRERFDNDVERFSDLEVGQTATIDAPLAMELITQAAVASTPNITRILDIGCGAGNNTIRLLREYSKPFDCDLNDLSHNMLCRARDRVSRETTGSVTLLEGDFRTSDLSDGSYDVVIAAAVLHHLRDDSDWVSAFTKVFKLLRPGGSFWITDLVAHETPNVQEMMWNRYGSYLEGLQGEDYRQKVFDYIEIEDSPRPVTFQLELLRRVGFAEVELLHKNSCFAAFGGIKTANKAEMATPRKPSD